MKGQLESKREKHLTLNSPSAERLSDSACFGLDYKDLASGACEVWGFPSACRVAGTGGSPRSKGRRRDTSSPRVDRRLKLPLLWHAPARIAASKLDFGDIQARGLLQAALGFQPSLVAPANTCPRPEEGHTRRRSRVLRFLALCCA